MRMSKRNTYSSVAIAAASLILVFILVLIAAPKPAAQDETSRLRVNVDLVQLSVAVTDHKGHYIAGLRPDDFSVYEDKIPEKIASFEEGNATGNRFNEIDLSGGGAAGRKGDAPEGNAAPEGSKAAGVEIRQVSGASVFILFDTSNYMYRGFVFAQDAIADFVRSMDDVDRLAFYSYSRDLSRATPLTNNHYQVVAGVRHTVAGDDAALYNSLLLTVKDASRLTGRKAIVVFSNGPDNASSVPPEDVAELAQSTGTIIYIVSTRQAQEEPVSTAAFERMSRATGGKAYFAGNWRGEKRAFASIREDLGHLYQISYYPASNPNRGWRTITVKLVGHEMKQYHVRTRDGYRLGQQTAVTTASNEIPIGDFDAK